MRWCGQFGIDFEILRRHFRSAQPQTVVAKAIPCVDVVEHGHSGRTVFLVFGDLDSRLYMEVGKQTRNEGDAARFQHRQELRQEIGIAIEPAYGLDGKRKVESAGRKELGQGIEVAADQIHRA